MSLFRFLRGLLGYNNPTPQDFGPEDKELTEAALNYKDESESSKSI